jgi:hypothetical protein
MYPEVTETIKKILATDPYFSTLEPKVINNGNCDEFANLIQDHCPEGDVFWGDELPTDEFNRSIHEPAYHCFFYYEGKDNMGEGRYYDAECPEGVASPVELPFFVRQYELCFA